MAIIADASSASLHPFVTEHVEPGTTVITDAWPGYSGISALGYTHQPRSQRAARARGEDPGELLPGVHLVASLAKRWLLGTHQGSVDETHLQSYLNEYVFRYNRRRSRSRGLVFYRVLELAVAHDPVRYRDLIVDPQRKPAPPTPPRRRGHPPSMDRPRAARPWRASSIRGSGQMNTPKTLHLCAVRNRRLLAGARALDFEFAPDLPSKSGFQILRRPMALAEVIQGESNDM